MVRAKKMESCCRHLYAIMHQETPWHDLYFRVCEMAVRADHLNCLIQARQLELPWSSMTFSVAAKFAKMEIIEYLRENGCPWDETVTAGAVITGRLEVLAFLHEHGCPWDESTCAAGVKYLQKQCLCYARSHGCPMSVSTLSEAQSRGLMCCPLEPHTPIIPGTPINPVQCLCGS